MTCRPTARWSRRRSGLESAAAQRETLDRSRPNWSWIYSNALLVLRFTICQALILFSRL